MKRRKDSAAEKAKEYWPIEINIPRVEIQQFDGDWTKVVFKVKWNALATSPTSSDWVDDIWRSLRAMR